MVAIIVSSVDRTIARFLAAEDDPEASAPGKQLMERECLRTSYGLCNGCGQHGKPIFRYEIDPIHAEVLTCLCDEWYDRLCQLHREAAAEFGDVACWNGPCRWSHWLEDSAMPWFCPSCWRKETADEQAHVKKLELICS